VGIGVGVGAGVGVDVGAGVGVGCLVGLGVGVGGGVGLGVGLGVRVGTGVGFLVGLGVGDGSGVTIGSAVTDTLGSGVTGTGVGVGDELAQPARNSSAAPSAKRGEGARIATEVLRTGQGWARRTGERRHGIRIRMPHGDPRCTSDPQASRRSLGCSTSRDRRGRLGT
jgi:hypothetical protein